MGKSSRTTNRKAEPEVKVDDKQEGDISESIEERLKRVELAHAQSSSDAYKFAFFFFMGVVLTIIVYPGVFNTIKSLKNHDGTVQAHGQARQDDVEQVVAIQGKDRIKRATDQTKTHSEKNKTNDDVKNSKHENFAVDDSDETDIDTDELSYTEIDLDEPANDVKAKREEDALIGETSDVTNEKTSIPLKLNPVSPDSEKVTIEVDPEQIEVFPETPKDTELKPKKGTQDNIKPEGDKTSAKERETKSRPAKSNQKTDATKQQSQKKDAKMNEKTPAMPKKIQDFKPTFLKTTKPKKIFADGRRIPPTELLPQKPNNSSVKIWMFDEFLSEQECDGLMRVHNQHVQDQSTDNPILCFDTIATLRKHLKNAGKHRVHVTPRDFTTGTTCVNSTFSSQLKTWLKGNWSYSTAFYPGESRFASIFENRVEQAMGLTPANGGKFQITSYPLGIGYKSHTDCTEDNEQRDRMATVLVYLDTVSEGGETDFPELGIWARPRKGRALMWNNMDEKGKCEPMSIHQAKKVVKGHKFILQRWYYYKSFYSLGKRPPEPPLPQRSPGQPRVSCDEYEYGSCRWYDEWNFEHMIEYEKQKYTLI